MSKKQELLKMLRDSGFPIEFLVDVIDILLTEETATNPDFLRKMMVLIDSYLDMIK